MQWRILMAEYIAYRICQMGIEFLDIQVVYKNN